MSCYSLAEHSEKKTRNLDFQDALSILLIMINQESLIPLLLLSHILPNTEIIGVLETIVYVTCVGIY